MIKIRKPTKREIYDFLERPWKRRHRGHTSAKIYLVLSWVMNHNLWIMSYKWYALVIFSHYLVLYWSLRASSLHFSLINKPAACFIQGVVFTSLFYCYIYGFFWTVIKNLKSQSSDDSNDVQIETSDSSVPKSLTDYITLSFVLVRIKDMLPDIWLNSTFSKVYCSHSWWLNMDYEYGVVISFPDIRKGSPNNIRRP